MNAFEIGMILYAATFMSLGLWSVAIARRRAGPLLANFFEHREEIGRRLKEGAVSPWDPFHPQGAKRWRLILFIEFGILVVLNFATA
jgi:hypothetical protein